MRVYTCIFKKDGKVAARDITGPFDRQAAVQVANDKLGLRENADELYALVPGQHTSRLWIIDREKISNKEESPAKVTKNSSPLKSGINLKDYVPSGF
jgi:hypothetical protein